MLKPVATIMILAACSFLGSLVGSHYLHSSTAQAASKKPPSNTVLAARIAALNRRVGNVEADVSNLSINVTTMRSDLNSLTAKVNGLSSTVSGVTGLSSRVSSLESKVNTLNTDMYGFSFGVKRRVDSLESTVDSICSARLLDPDSLQPIYFNPC